MQTKQNCINRHSVHYCTTLAILTTANDLAIELSKATKTTRNKMTTLLDYLATNPNAAVAYRKSDVMLKTHSDGSYLSVINARSRAAGNFYFSNKKTDDSN